MIRLKNKNLVYFFALFLDAIILDFFSKYYVDLHLQFREKIVLIPDILSCEKVYNTGAAFSLMNEKTSFLIAISIITILLILAYVFKKKYEMNAFENAGLALIAGGAVGNLIDRLTKFYVVDFIQLEFINFPIFNLADIFINIGVIILIVSMFISKNDK